MKIGVLIIIILSGLGACTALGTKPKQPNKPIPQKTAVSVNPPAVKSVAPVPAPIVSQPVVTQPVVSNFTTIYNNVEYYLDPTITVYSGEAVIALYTIDKDKKRVYMFVPKKDLTSPLILTRH